MFEIGDTIKLTFNYWEKEFVGTGFVVHKDEDLRYLYITKKNSTLVHSVGGGIFIYGRIVLSEKTHNVDADNMFRHLNNN